MMEYIQRMRKLIGHEPLLLCGASIIVFNASNQVLMLRRSDNGCWCFPGGVVELGEQTETTARREFFEETGLSVDEVSIFGVFSGEELHYTYPNGDEVFIVDVVYTSNGFHGDITMDSESNEYGFFSIAELPIELSPPVVPVVEELRLRSGVKV